MQIIADFLNKVNMTRECHIISILKIRAEAFKKTEQISTYRSMTCKQRLSETNFKIASPILEMQKFFSNMKSFLEDFAKPHGTKSVLPYSFPFFLNVI